MENISCGHFSKVISVVIKTYQPNFPLGFLSFISDISAVCGPCYFSAQNIVNILNISFTAIHYNIQMENRQSKENISKLENIYWSEVLKLNDKTLRLNQRIISEEYLIYNSIAASWE